MTRPTWDEYFINLAQQAALMGTCDRAQVGAVVVRDRRALSTGYNGAPRGLAHCSQVGHQVVDGHCVRTLHAEINALIFAGIERTTGATMYVTHLPCRRCAGMIVNARIVRVVYAHGYGHGDGRDILSSGGVEIVHWQGEEE